MNKKYLLIIKIIILLIFLSLSFFRFANADETLYLRNTIILSENIKNGQLFGQYSTGLHGVIFNLPVALIFLITGPSVSIATIYNLIIATITIVFLYKILFKITHDTQISQLTCLLVLTSYHFVNIIPSFLKDIHVILSILIFLYILIFNNHKYKQFFIGISLLLILDAKEYVFFVLLPVYLIWLSINQLISNNKIYKKILNIIIKFLIVLFPSIIWLFLMFFTPFIPINMFVASTIGITNKNSIKSNFLPTYVTNFVNFQINTPTPSIKLPTTTPTPTPTPIEVDKNIKIQILNATNIKNQATLLREKLIQLKFKNITIGDSNQKSIENQINTKSQLTTASAYFQKNLSNFPATFSSNLKDTSNFDIVFVIGTKLNLIPAAKPTTKIINPTATPTVILIEKIATPTPTPTPASKETNIFQKISKYCLTYINKILLPRSFSFIAIPKIIIVPALYSSILFFIEYSRRKKIIPPLILSLFFWIYLIIYVLRSSHGRYLLPIIPIIYLFYVLFLFQYTKNKKQSIIVLSISLLFFLLGLKFETKYIFIKILINIFITTLTLLLIIKRNFKQQLIKIIIFILATFSLGTAILSSYSIGQIGQFLRWGYNGECKKIVSYFNNGETVLFNQIEDWNELLYFYRKDTSANPEWKAELANWIPKKKLLKLGNTKNTYIFTWKTTKSLKQQVDKNQIEKIAIIKSTIPNYEFPMQEKIEELKTLKWLKLEKVEQLKNKELYIFNIIK